MCSLGQCAISTCEAGFENCNGGASDGCETNKLNDAANCGGCGNNCSQSGAVSLCSAGTCTVSACKPGFGNSNNSAADGCESDFQTNAAHCGSCGFSCAALNYSTSTCAAGSCTGSICKPGFGNCNNSAADGCEADFQTNAAHCGSCGFSCAALNYSTSTCAAGSCAGSICKPGFGNCNNSTSDGCETNLSNDAGHCGNCATVCSVGQTCTSGVCG